LYLAPLRDLLGTQPLPLADLAIACVPAVLGYLAVRLDLRPRQVQPRSAEDPA
jgi:Ca2+-transporting ATPase